MEVNVMGLSHGQTGNFAVQIAVAMPDENARSMLAEQIRTYGAERHIRLQVNELSGSGQVVAGDWRGYDILFLTACFQGQDNFRLAEAFRWVDECAGLVLIADTDRYVFSGYELHALGYLLWPASQNMINTILERAVDRVKEQREHRLPLPLQGYTRCCDSRTILYMRQEAKQVRVHTVDCSFLASCSLDWPRQMDRSSLFAPISDTCLVNLAYVCRTGKEWVQLDYGDVRHVILSLNDEYRVPFTDALKALYARLRVPARKTEHHLSAEGAAASEEDGAKQMSSILASQDA